MFNIYVDSNAGVGNYQFKVEGRNIKLSTGNVYLMAIIDWFSRKVLSWRVFNTKNWTGRCFYNFIDLCLRNRDSYQNGTYRTCASLYCTERVCRSRADLYRASNCREVG